MERGREREKERGSEQWSEGARERERERGSEAQGSRERESEQGPGARERGRERASKGARERERERGSEGGREGERERGSEGANGRRVTVGPAGTVTSLTPAAAHGRRGPGHGRLVVAVLTSMIMSRVKLRPGPWLSARAWNEPESPPRSGPGPVAVTRLPVADVTVTQTRDREKTSSWRRWQPRQPGSAPGNVTWQPSESLTLTPPSGDSESESNFTSPTRRTGHNDHD